MKFKYLHPAKIKGGFYDQISVRVIDYRVSRKNADETYIEYLVVCEYGDKRQLWVDEESLDEV